MNLNREIAAEKNFVDRYDAERAEREHVRSHSRPFSRLRPCPMAARSTERQIRGPSTELPPLPDEAPVPPRTARTATPARTTAQVCERTSWRPSQEHQLKSLDDNNIF